MPNSDSEDIIQVLDSFKNAIYNPQDGVYYGLLRGVCKSNSDPLKLGRILVYVPALHGESVVIDELHWATPCVDFGGNNQLTGLVIPPVDSTVWVLYECGDTHHPVYMGVWWGGDELPEDLYGDDGSPKNFFIFSYLTQRIRSAIDGSELIFQFNEDTYMYFKEGLIKIYSGESQIDIMPDSIQAYLGNTTMSLEPERASLTSGGSSIELLDSVINISSGTVNISGVVNLGS